MKSKKKVKDDPFGFEGTKTTGTNLTSKVSSHIQQ
jgi:hypothetical protein